MIKRITDRNIKYSSFFINVSFIFVQFFLLLRLVDKYYEIHLFKTFLLCNLHIGTIVGLFFSKYIHRIYGKKSVLILGIILFSIFYFQYFVVDSIEMSAIMLFFAGIGFGLVGYELIIKNQKFNYNCGFNKTKFFLSIILYAIIHYFVFFVMLKFSTFTNKIGIFLIFLCLFSLLSFLFFILSDLCIKNIVLAASLSSIGIWISAISEDIVMLLAGSCIAFISFAFLLKARSVLFSDSQVFNIQICIGALLSSFVSFVFDRFSLYFLFLVSMFFILYLFFIKTKLILER